MLASAPFPTRSGNEPFISRESVRAALEGLLYSSERRPTLGPLHYLTVVDQLIEDPAMPRMEHPRVFALEQLLVHEVERGYITARERAGLPQLVNPRSQPEVITELTLTHKPLQNAELNAWAILYFRFVLIECDLSTEAFAKPLAVTDRTARRLYASGVQRLTTRLLQMEYEARRLRGERLLLSRLPGEPEIPLIGREGWLDDFGHLLAERTHHVLVSGPVGIGKSALVRAALTDRVRSGAVDQLVWIDYPASITEVMGRLREGLVGAADAVLNVAAYTQTQRLVVVLRGIGALLNDENRLYGLLGELGSATVILIHSQYISLPVLTAYRRVEPLTEDATRRLTERFWRWFHGSAEIEPDEIDDLASRSGGNAEALKLLVAGYRRLLPRQLHENSVGYTLSRLIASLSPAGRWGLCAASLLPSEGSPAYSLPGLWGRERVNALNELMSAHLLESQPGTDSVRLLSFVSEWLRADYASSPEGWVRRGVNEVIEALDEPIQRAYAPACALAQRILREGWPELAMERRKSWLASGWRGATTTEVRAGWLEILRQAVRAEAADDARVWLGWGVCARRLLLWDESLMALGGAIARCGLNGEFVLQAEAVLERSIYLRLRGEYAAALDDLAQVALRGRQYEDDRLVARAAFEQAQIALDRREGQQALNWLASAGNQPRMELLWAEARLLVGDPDACIAQVETLLPRYNGERDMQGRAYTLLARARAAKGELDAARQAQAAAVTLLEAAGDLFALGRAYVNLGGLVWEARDSADETLELLSRAAHIQSLTGDPITSAGVMALRLRVMAGTSSGV